LRNQPIRCQQLIEPSNADKELDPAGDTTGSERYVPDDTLRQEPDTEDLKHNTYPVTAEQEDYLGTGEANGKAKEYNEERRDFCDNSFAFFACTQGFTEPPSWFIESKVSNTRIHNYFSNGIGNSTSVGYSFMHILENLLRNRIPLAPISNGLKDMLKTLREHYHSSIGTSLFA